MEKRFRGSLFGYSRKAVDAELGRLEGELTAQSSRADGLAEGLAEAELRAEQMDALADELAAIVARRERELEHVRAELREAGVSAFEGSIHLDVGPLADFATLAGIEDVLNGIDGVEGAQIKRFSGGRATLGIRLSAPVELLTVLQERSDLAFKVKKAGRSHLMLDVIDPSEAAA